VICPRCNNKLTEESLDGSRANVSDQQLGPYRAMYVQTNDPGAVEIWVNRCDGCKGVWFDQGELTDAMQTLAIVTTADPPLPFSREPKGPCSCPRCDVQMEATRSSAAKVVYDRCPQCHGIWFDAGEVHAFADPLVAIGAFMAVEFRKHAKR
jgi:Zn-finger nucleic acid-binding protein